MSGGTFGGALTSGEEQLLSWTSSTVHWAGDWDDDPQTPTAFAATNRRIVFSNGESTTSIGYDHVRAVETDGVSGGPGAYHAFVAFGGLGLLAGLVVATADPLNGVGLVVLSLMLLVAGSTVGDSLGGDATVTLVIDNERQRLTFSAEEGVAEELRRLAAENR